MSDLRERAKDHSDAGTLRRQLEDSRKASATLQQMVDALASLPALEQFVPFALRIVARAFETGDCAYYEHRRGDPIRLRYWFLDDRVFGSEDIRAFGDDDPNAEVKSLEAGFLISDAYLGVPFRMRTKAQVVDHGEDRPGEEWRDLRRRNQWRVSLNVPLVIGGEADGALVINRGAGGAFTPSEIDLAERLAQQLALAMEVDRLAADARQAASAQARELTAKTQLEEMAKIDSALQQITDALATMPDLVDFIPAALRIIAKTFNLKDCAYYEHRRGDPIRLRYWYFENRVLAPDDIAALDSDDDAFMKHLAVDGFTVPDDYIGVPFRKRTTATVIDHSKGDPPSVFDVECVRRGWELELNVPLVVAGEADGALLIYRSLDAPFTDAEIKLAERLSQQLALAIEASRLSAAANDAAIANERERAARDRSAELSRYADVLTRTIDSLVEEDDLRGFLGRLLIIASEQLHAPVTEYWANDGAGGTILRLTCRDGRIHIGSDEAGDRRAQGIKTAPGLVSIGRFQSRTKHRVIDMIEDKSFRDHVTGFGMDVEIWCRERLVRQLVVIPLIRDGFENGAFCLYLPADVVLDEPKLDLAFSLGQQVALAVRMTELAEATRRAAVAQAREKAAEERAVELSNANEVLRSTLDQLSKQQDLQSFPRTILHQAMKHTGAKDGLMLLLNGFTGELEPLDYISIDGLPPHDAFTRPFSATSSPSWAALVESRGPVVFTTEEVGPFLSQGFVDWHRARANRSILATAMYIDGQPYGYFGLTLEERARDVSVVKMGLIQSLAQQATLAIQLTRLAEKSQQAAVMLERQQVVVQERANLAREIHDRLAQGYAAILIQQHTMRRSLLRDAEADGRTTPLLNQLDIIERLSRENLTEARRTMDELRTDPFGPGELAASLERCLQQISRERDFAVSLHLDAELPLLRRYVETEICRIVLEAVTNAHKHARVPKAQVTARVLEGELQITVSDDGVGFDARTIGSSFGLSSMQERAARAGARVDVRSRPGCGTQVQITLAT